MMAHGVRAANPPGRLRVAILAEGGFAPIWAVDAFRVALDLPEIALVGVFGLAPARPRSLTERLFDGLDRLERYFRGRTAGPDELYLARALPARQLGWLAASWGGGGPALDDNAISTLVDFRLDLILCCTRVPLALPRSIARHGAWGIELGYGVPAFAPWAGTAELAAGSPVTVTRIVDYSKPAFREVYVACGETVTGSVRRNRLRAVATSGMVLRRLVQSLGANSVRRRSLPRLLPLPGDYPKYTDLSPGLLARACLGMGRSILDSRLKRRVDFPPWHIAYCFSDLPLPDIGFDRLRYLAPAPGTFWADPFPLTHQGRHYILFEELPYDTQRGRLLAIEVFEHRDAGAPVVVLERDYHLSYPHVFHWQGELYLVPETRNAGKVQLLRCVDFPSHWELHKLILDDIRAVDATLWHQDATWWMFVNVAIDGGQVADELHLYFADSLESHWQRHPASPLSADLRCARPAGPLFAKDGVVFRPSQDGAECYGHALWLNQIEQMDRMVYRERSVARIAPDWHPAVSCVHTLGQAGRLTVLDCVLQDSSGLDVQRDYPVSPGQGEHGRPSCWVAGEIDRASQRQGGGVDVRELCKAGAGPESTAIR